MNSSLILGTAALLLLAALAESFQLGAFSQCCSRGNRVLGGSDPLCQEQRETRKAARTQWKKSQRKQGALLAVPQREFDSRDTRAGFEVDRDIKIGHVDDKLKEAIAPALKVLGGVVELIDTTDDVFQFKYMGFIRNKHGIEAWAGMLIKDCYPDVKGVKFVTNRVRDKRDN